MMLDPTVLFARPAPLRVLVLGLGESGLAMARWCARFGARVRVADTRSAPPGLAALASLGGQGGDAEAHAAQAAPEFVSGPFAASLESGLLAQIDLLALSPGLSPIDADVARVLDAARAAGIPVWGELEFFSRALVALRTPRAKVSDEAGDVADAADMSEAPDAPYMPRVLAITGTNGKTTTTALTALLCERAHCRVAVAGNISPSLLDRLSEALDTNALPEVWVLELSSFQLEGAHTFVADAAAVLNLSEDHLDWHGSFEAYAAAKKRIFSANAVRVLNRNDDAVAIWAQGVEPARVITFGIDSPVRVGDFGIEHEGALAWLVQCVSAEPDAAKEAPSKRRAEPGSDATASANTTLRRLMPVEALRIPGLHNAANALAALCLTRAIGLPLAPLLHGLRDYRGEPHRVETIATVDEVDYIDDSKATNVGATVAALDGLARRTVLIAGGDGKGQDFAPLAPAIARWCRAVLLIGRDAPKLRAALASAAPLPTQSREALDALPCIDCVTLEDALAQASHIAAPGDAVLLSPACASFDMFRNYVHRAEVFRRAVEELASERGLML